MTVIFLYSRNLKLFYLFDMTLLWGLRFLGNVFVWCQSLGLIMLTIHKLFRLVCPSRLKYWCYFRWVLGDEDYHLICKEVLGKHPQSFFPLSNAWVILTSEVVGHKLLCWVPLQIWDVWPWVLRGTWSEELNFLSTDNYNGYSGDSS